MRCSICGREGHNARTCPNKDDEDVQYALWVKFDNITENEATDLLHNIMKTKSKIAPDARGTFAKAKKKDLPMKIKDVLGLEEKNGAKKK